MASQTQGIQQLLAAEKKAADKVAEARKRKLYSELARTIQFDWLPVIYLLICRYR